jgi:hypothetical protein
LEDCSERYCQFKIYRFEFFESAIELFDFHYSFDLKEAKGMINYERIDGRLPA